MKIFFDQPAWMYLGLLAVPLAIVGWRTLGGFDIIRRTLAVGSRVVLVLLLAVMLAGPHHRRDHDALTVIGLLDISGSVRRFAQIPDVEPLRRNYLEHLRTWFRDATATRTPDDRFGLVVFDGEAIAVVSPTRGELGSEHLDVSAVSGTRIDEAIRLGLAMFPADAARRLVLVTDGNETMGDALVAARQAAGEANVPIDVLPIAYSVTGDAQIVALEAPASAATGQTVTIRIITEATEPTPAQLTLRREGVGIDLNGDLPGRAPRVILPAGRSVHLAEVRLGDTPVNRFEATLTPDDPGSDVLPDNNHAEAVVSTPSRGRILIIDVDGGTNSLAELLVAAELPVSVAAPATLPNELLALQNYDLVVLDNVAAAEVSPLQQEMLSRYVHDLGGGLIMIGGEQSFGAGGWNNTALEKVLPVELDPPSELRLPRAALVLVIDRSGSMNQPVAGARATQQEVANEAAARAIESLRSESLVGVVTFHAFARATVPLQRNDDPAAISGKIRGITAGGGTNLEPALRLAFEMLEDVEVERKRIVCLSDGRSPTGHLEDIARRMADHDIMLSTIGIGDEADEETLSRLADLGGGTYYPVYNIKGLPRVLVDSVQSINKPLIREGIFAPQVLPTGLALTRDMHNAPPLNGLVITAPRADPRAVIAMIHPDGEPLLAWWQAGLGRTAVFTSDLGGPWSSAWENWAPARTFWTELVRRTARPPVSQEAELFVTIENGRLLMTLEAIDQTRGYLDYLDVPGALYRPDGTTQAVRLRQTAPGRYEASANAEAAGSYIVALNPRRGERQLAPVIAGVSRSTGEEFRRYASNTALLDRIAQATGGRWLDLLAPSGVDLFDRTALPPTIALRPLWPWLLLAAVSLLLIDVTVRRVAWTTAGVLSAMRRALVWVTPGGRGQAATATLATLRQASHAVDQRIREQRPPTPRSDRPAGPRPIVRDHQTPEPSRIAAALNRFRRRAETPPVSPTDGTDPIPERNATDELADTTSGLFAAKRRAQARMERDSSDSE